MSFQWDPRKATATRRRHKVDFADAVGVFDDPYAVTRDDPHPSEQRHVTLGPDMLGRVLVVSWTGRAESIRIISAPPATARERRQYEMEM
jgi:hypothetical protein